MSTFFQKPARQTVLSELHKNCVRLNLLNDITQKAKGPYKRLAELLQEDYTERAHECVEVIREIEPQRGL